MAEKHIGLPFGSDGKEFTCNAGDSGLIPRSGRSPGEGNGKTTPAFLPGKSMDKEHGGQQSMESQRVRHD